MNLKVGIVGLPNAGKSTLFNALLKKQVAFAANYPFATIEPNIGVVPVPDARLEKLAQITRDDEKLEKLPPLVPATVEFVDIAGLVKGASEGQGLGNKFLSHIREVNLICHVIRHFADPDIVHVDGTVDPTRDKDVIETELVLADLQTLGKQIEPRMNATKEQLAKWQVILRLREALNAGKLARAAVTDPDEQEAIRDLQLLTMKPILYVSNVSEEQLTKHQSDKATAERPVLISAKIEAELANLTVEEQAEYMKELGVEESGLERLIRKAYEQLGLISFLTAGEIEVRAWTIENGMKAPEAAGVIHTDFTQKFIKAEIVSFEDLLTLGSKSKAKEQGRLRLEGKEYVMKDGDVVEFKIGA